MLGAGVCRAVLGSASRVGCGKLVLLLVSGEARMGWVIGMGMVVEQAGPTFDLSC
jgi:hypothetical protein